jgi:hypothetical protein
LAEKMGAGVLAALVLICSAAVAADAQDCTRGNADAVMRVPAEFGNPATCFMHAQAYLAGSSIGRELDANERVRIVCLRSEAIAASLQP